MPTQLDTLMEKLRCSVEAEIEVEMAKRREEKRFRFENRKIVFEQEASQRHRETKTNAIADVALTQGDMQARPRVHAVSTMDRAVMRLRPGEDRTSEGAIRPPVLPHGRHNAGNEKPRTKPGL